MPRPRKKNPLEKIELALIYIDDGALRMGVTLLREAADEIEKIAAKRDAEIEKVIGKRIPKAGGSDGPKA